MQDLLPRTPEYDLVAEISKAKGLDGQLVALESGRLSVLYPGLEVWIVPPTLRGVRSTVITEAIDDFKKRGVLIRLEGIEERTQATELVGRYLLARTEQIKEATLIAGEEDGNDDDTVAPAGPEQPLLTPGTSFTDTAYGNLGILDSIKPGPAYQIWVIDGPYGQLDIPAVAEYILEEGVEQVTLTLPRGFIEITGGKRSE